MLKALTDERRRREILGGSDEGNFEKLRCLRLHFVRFEGRYIQNQTVKVKREKINAYLKFLVRNRFWA